MRERIVLQKAKAWQLRSPLQPTARRSLDRARHCVRAREEGCVVGAAPAMPSPRTPRGPGMGVTNQARPPHGAFLGSPPGTGARERPGTMDPISRRRRRRRRPPTPPRWR